MGGRYVITGAQIGVIQGVLTNTKDAEAANMIKPILDDIFTKQFLGDSRSSIDYDVKELEKVSPFNSLNKKG